VMVGMGGSGDRVAVRGRTTGEVSDSTATVNLAARHCLTNAVVPAQAGTHTA